jgi:uncharacterized protein YkwD
MRLVALTTCSAVLPILCAATVPAAGAAPARMSGGERALARAVNHARARYGLPALRRSRGLARAADYHSQEMLSADYFAHTSRDGGPFSRRVRRFARYHRVGEVIAMVSGCSRRGRRYALRLLLASPTHRAILLAGHFRRIGVGMRAGRLGARRVCMITADLGSRR